MFGVCNVAPNERKMQIFIHSVRTQKTAVSEVSLVEHGGGSTLTAPRARGHLRATLGPARLRQPLHLSALLCSQPHQTMKIPWPCTPRQEKPPAHRLSAHRLAVPLKPGRRSSTAVRQLWGQHGEGARGSPPRCCGTRHPGNTKPTACAFDQTLNCDGPWGDLLTRCCCTLG